MVQRRVPASAGEGRQWTGAAQPRAQAGGSATARRVAMPRPPRPYVPEATVHVVARCNNREFSFATLEDFATVLGNHRGMVRDDELALDASTVMSNHGYLLRQAPRASPLARLPALGPDTPQLPGTEPRSGRPATGRRGPLGPQRRSAGRRPRAPRDHAARRRESGGSGPLHFHRNFRREGVSEGVGGMGRVGRRRARGFVLGRDESQHMGKLWFLTVALALAGTLVPSTSSACSCMWGGPFLKVVRRADLVVRAKVLNYHGESRGIQLAMDAEVVEVLKGSARARRIRIWGDNGALCRPYVSAFPIHTEWILAIDPLPGRPWEYFISICGGYSLKVRDGQVTGHISSSHYSDPVQTMSLEELLAALKAP